MRPPLLLQHQDSPGFKKTGQLFAQQIMVYAFYVSIPASCFIREKDTGKVEESHWIVSG